MLRNPDQESARACSAGAEPTPACKGKHSHLTLEKCHWSTPGFSIFYLGMAAGG